jgi:hypothetical protein
MMGKAYWINTFRKVSDAERLSAYVELAGPVMREFGGRFLARGTPARVFEAGVMERTVRSRLSGLGSRRVGPLGMLADASPCVCARAPQRTASQPA